ncbi:hypothetical protein [Nocardioides sp. AE5]|uniref:hypothetical protein n=1 Tax=Nocardioides sp. AE5 TaxID=2962573 RepID=UPI002881B897|nr:hypothetical protein [Nocardioides sp. AE5]MDT0203785.1 hypothetical protein [Nocardioides sp. AE5]
MSSDPRQRPHHRPAMQAGAFFDGLIGGTDPAQVSEAADRAATLLVRGAADSADAAVADRLLHLADEEGLETLAELWSHAAFDSLAGCLWRLYLLRAWVHATPNLAADQFEVGRTAAPVARVVAGVADPPGPDQVRAMIDAVLRGIAVADFADVLFRAAAFARVVAVGRATLEAPDAQAMLGLAEQLEAAGHLELAHALA